ncbi:hypothetical protein BC937DRAFT_94596 [Endogone sp. FLAS-F59071]|nr:hypothetical protein BC937DRAFT_94596 [Endogone sp. FLAS-F59071]|eukprot:RUS20688.1 hypothetical protein BC937DRAFT_94596 [Endogone sp. FLAS-F59071]
MLPSILFANLLLVLSFYLLKLCEATSLGPGARHRACTTVYDNTLYVWGGIEDTTVSPTYANFTSAYLPLSTGNITWVDLSWNIPSYLANPNQTISTWPCLVSPSGILLVGGNNMFGYDLVHNTYVQLNTTGVNPLASLSNRTNVRMVQVEDSFYVFGGYSGYGLNTTAAVPQTDMYILNLTMWEWSVSSVNDPQSIPPNYDWPALAGAAVYYSDIYKFDINAGNWSSVTPYGSVLSGYDDATPVVYKGKVYIFYGGTNDATPGVSDHGYSTYSNVIRLYDVASNTISAPTYSNIQNAPPAELYVSAALADDVVIVVSGQTTPSINVVGIWAYNVTVQDWTTTVAADPQFPSHFRISASTAPSTAPSTASSSSLSPTISSTPSNSTNVGVIVGPIVGGIVVIAVAAFFLIGYIKNTKNKESPEPQPQDPPDITNPAQFAVVGTGNDEIPSIHYAEPLYATQILDPQKPNDVPWQKPNDLPWQNSNNTLLQKPDDVHVHKPDKLDNMYVYIPSHKPDQKS